MKCYKKKNLIHGNTAANNNKKKEIKNKEQMENTPTTSVYSSHTNSHPRSK